MKFKRGLILFLLVLCSCSGEKEKNTNLIIQYFEYFNQHRWEKIASMYAELSEFKDPNSGSKIAKQTRTQIIKKYTELSHIFSNIHDEVIAIYPSERNFVTVEFISSGTAINGSKFELAICTIFTIENGFITKDFTYYDNF